MNDVAHIADLIILISASLLALLALVGCFVHPAKPIFHQTITAGCYLLIAAATFSVALDLREIINLLASNQPYLRESLKNRFFGHYAWAFWMHYICTVVPQLLWSGRLRRRVGLVLIIAIISLLPSLVGLLNQLIIFLQRG